MDNERPAQSPATSHDTAPQPEHTQVLSPAGSGGDSNGARATGHREGDAPTQSQPSSTERHLSNPPPSERHPALPHSHSHDNPCADRERVTAPAPTPAPRPLRGREGHVRVSSPRHTLASVTGLPPAPLSGSAIDWIVPVDEKNGTRRTVGERLQPTIDHAVTERDKCAKKALWTGYTLNIAIGMQVLLGALTTGIAAAVTNGRQASMIRELLEKTVALNGNEKAQVSTAILGGLSTLVASYLARARGSGEPELSIRRTKDLEQFLRECKAFQMDHAHEYSTPENGLEGRLEDLRQRFEELLGNVHRERNSLTAEIGLTRTIP